MGQLLQAYCERLRMQAAGRLGFTEGGLDPAQENAALKRAQREGVEIKNAVLRGEYAPIKMLAEVLADASQGVVERFEQLPGQLRKACPELPPAAIDQVMATIAAARNEWARATAELASKRLDELSEELPDYHAEDVTP
jgi:phage terminase Nu1 subunit (DNA packaging protein)